MRSLGVEHGVYSLVCLMEFSCVEGSLRYSQVNPEGEPLANRRYSGNKQGS